MNEQLLREFIRAQLAKTLLEMAAPLKPKHFVGGDTGNPVVQKSIDKNALDTYEIGRPVEAFAFDPDDASIDPIDVFLSGGQAPARVALKKGDAVTLVSTDIKDIVKKGNTSHAVIAIQSGAEAGMHAIVPIARLEHNMGAGGKKGAISGQTLGQAVEHAVAGGLTGKSDDDIIADAKADSRLADTVSVASEKDVEQFEAIIKKAAALVRPYGQSLQVRSARVEDESDTALVDVPAETANGPIAVHVKYNDPNRLFGLQQSMKKQGDGSKVSIGSPSTRIFRQVRAEFVQKHLLSAEAYRNYVSENPAYSQDMEKELKIIRSKGGTNSGDVKPVLLPRQFVRRDSEPGDMVTMLKDPDGQFINALEDAGYVDTLADEIKSNLAPEGSPTYYFKFNNGATKLEVVNFDLVGVEFDIKPTNDGKMNAFNVAAVFPDGRRVEEVFYIALSSSRRGHPPQVLNGKNYSALVG